MQIIVWKDKHVDKYYDVSTLEAWDASCIEILKELTDPTYGYMNPERYEPYVSDETRKLAETDITGLSTDVLALIEKNVLRARAQIASGERIYENAKRQHTLALEYIAAGKSPTIQRGRYLIPAAWEIIQNRSGGEYEVFELETVFSIYNYVDSTKEN